MQSKSKAMYAAGDCRDQNAEDDVRGTKKQGESSSEKCQLEELLDAFTQIDSPLLDLSFYTIESVPQQLLNLTHIEYLYLSNNCLVSLPNNFFPSLPNLKWLDLRFNQLARLPRSIASARKITSLLLGNNSLQFLPIEMGCLKTLSCLNLTSNPLQFPPPSVVERGIAAILKCLKQTEAILVQGDFDMDSLSHKDPAATTQLFEELTQLHFHSILSDESEEELTKKSSPHEEQQLLYSGNRSSGTGGLIRGGLLNRGEMQSTSAGGNGRLNGSNFSRSWSLRQRIRRPSDEFAELDELRPRSASLQKRKDYREMRQEKDRKIERAGASGRLDTTSRMAREMQDAKMRDFNIKIAMEEQKLKDKMQLDSWRQDLRDIQRRNYHLPKETPSQMLMRTEKSPYAVEKKHLRLRNRNNMYKEEEANKTLAAKNMISPRSKQQIEQARAAKDADLEKRIKLHALNIQQSAQKAKGQRRSTNKSRPNSANTVGLTVAEARRDLEKALQLQRELHMRKVEVDLSAT